MGFIAAVNYTRDRIEAAWCEVDEATLKHLDGRKSLTRQVTDFVARNRSRYIDRLATPRSFDACLDELLAWLKQGGRQFDYVTVVGYGPIASMKAASPDFGLVSQRSSAPFAGHSVARAVQRGLDLPPNQIEWFNDCSALAYYDYWSKVELSRKHYQRRIAAWIIGEGVGGAVLERTQYGLVDTPRSELGHIPVHHNHDDDESRGPSCPWHKGCLTSHVCLDAIKVRAKHAGRSVNELYADPSYRGWGHVADYIAQACLTLVLTNAPSDFILAGEVIDRAPYLVDYVRLALVEKLDGFYAGTENYDDSNFRRMSDYQDVMLIGGIHRSIAGAASRINGA